VVDSSRNCNRVIVERQRPYFFIHRLMSLFVLPQFRGQGIAKQLIQRVIQLAKQLGYSTVYLWTEDKQEMYSRLGWKFFQETVYAWAKITIMTYDLTSVT
jgi:GNAT superfamily N-acetyltransferase